MGEDYGKNIVTISMEQLPLTVEQAKLENKRLGQIFAAYDGERFGIFYCFIEALSPAMISYRVPLEVEQELPSIAHIYENALFYEIEMAQMFGVKVMGLGDPEELTLYRVSKTSPFAPEKGKEEKDA